MQVTSATPDISWGAAGKRSACMTHLQHKQRDGPPCPNGDLCTNRHTEDIQELLHWTKYFGERHCKFGNSCRLLPHCLYRHPPEAQAKIKAEEKRRAQGAQDPNAVPPPLEVDKRQLCMQHLQYKQRGAPPCPNGANCKDLHTEEELELIHWTKYFGERPCKFGISCRLLPFCLYGHPGGAGLEQNAKDCLSQLVISHRVMPPCCLKWECHTRSRRLKLECFSPSHSLKQECFCLSSSLRLRWLSLSSSFSLDLWTLPLVLPAPFACSIFMPVYLATFLVAKVTPARISIQRTLQKSSVGSISSKMSLARRAPCVHLCQGVSLHIHLA